MISNYFPYFVLPDSVRGKRAAASCGYCSQLELQAINERGWVLTKAAEPATSTPKTTLNARNFIIARIESSWILELNFQMVDGENESGYGQ